MGTAVMLPTIIEDEHISLERESLRPVLSSPSHPDQSLKFSYALFRRRDHHFLGNLKGSIVDPNTKMSVVVKISDESAGAMGYMAEALNALERHLHIVAPPEKDEDEKLEDEYEIYL